MSAVHPLEYKLLLGWTWRDCNALFALMLLPLVWGATASAEMVPVAPEASEWIYTGVRCEAVTTYPSEEAAIQGGVALYNGYCGNARVASRGVWGTTSAPMWGACGSTSRYPKFSLGVENINARHVKIAFCNGQDGWYVYRTRTVRCPPGYSNSSNQCLPTGENIAKAPSGCEPGAGVAVVGNPINLSSRSKQETTADIVVDATKGWVFKRYYSSRAHYHGGRMGKHWRHTFERRLVETKNGVIISVALYRDDGQVLRFSLLNGAWKADGDIDYRLVGLDIPSSTARWQVTTPRDEIETYDEHGNLSQVADRQGQVTTLSYDDNRWIKSIRYPNEAELTLTYHASGLLKLVQLSDDIFVKYKYSSANLLSQVNNSEGDFSALHYEDARFPGALTGLTDERGIRFATWAYDELARPTLSEHAGGVDRTSLTYHSDGKITVANALGKQAVYSFKFVNGLKRVSSVQGTPSLNCAGANRAYTYTPDGRLKSKTDWKGHLTTYDYNERGLEVSRTEAAGTPHARTITTEWHPTLFLPVMVTEPRRITHYTYDDQGRQLSQSVTQR
jgi:YD repeat-containing protein